MLTFAPVRGSRSGRSQGSCAAGPHFEPSTRPNGRASTAARRPRRTSGGHEPSLHAEARVTEKVLGPHFEPATILSVFCPRQALAAVNWDRVDASGLVTMLLHRMKVKRGQGFTPVEPLSRRRPGDPARTRCGRRHAHRRSWLRRRGDRPHVGHHSRGTAALGSVSQDVALGTSPAQRSKPQRAVGRDPNDVLPEPLGLHRPLALPIDHIARREGERQIHRLEHRAPEHQRDQCTAGPVRPRPPPADGRRRADNIVAYRMIETLVVPMTAHDAHRRVDQGAMRGLLGVGPTLGTSIASAWVSWDELPP